MVGSNNEFNYELDDLTQIYNRKAFYTHTKKVLLSNRDNSFFICAVNVDKFKVVNDLFGTRAGDELLRYIAQSLAEYAAGNPLIVYGRMHADDFLLCLPCEDGREVEISSFLDKKMEEYPLPLNIIIKCGIYHIHNMGIPVEIMCDRANMAIAQIKGKFSVNFNIYDEKLRNQILQEQEINSEMIQALSNNQFEPYYQPKFNMESGKVIGAEALVRWVHPEKGLISPGIFIPIFEKNGFIANLDRYIWERVCSDIRGWIKDGYAACPISVNVSRAELYDVKLPQILLNLVEKYNIPIGLLQLEITESAYTDSPEQMINAVDNLKKAGFTILMDDFGSGYSSLNTLKDIPIDVLKLDLKFLYDMENNKKADNILKSVVQMAKRLSLSVIAEGVENRKQVDFLKSVGCLKAQGYFYSRPVPKADFEEIIRDSDNVALGEDDYREALINVDDIIGRYHREDEVEWYRSAVIMLKGEMFEYDMLRDSFTIFDMKMDAESNELSKIEIPNFISDRSYLKYVYQEDVDSFINHINDINGGSVEVRMRSLNSSSGFRWYRFTDHPVKNEDGEITSIVGVILDVSGNYQARALMSLMNTFSRNEIDIHQKLTECSKEIVKSFNVKQLYLDFPKRVDKNEIATVGFNMEMGRYIPADRPEFTEQQLYDIHMASDEYNISILPTNDDTTLAVYLADIGELYTVMISFVFEGKNRQFEEYDKRQMSEISRCIFTNIEKTINARLDRQNLDMYENAFRSSRVMIREWDIINKTLIRSEGYADEDGKGRAVYNVPDSLIEADYVHPDYVDEYRRVFDELAKGNDQLLMVKVRSKSGCYEWLWCDYRVIFDQNGNPIKAVGTGEDVNSLFENQQNVRRRLKQESSFIPGVISWIEIDVTEDAIVASSGDISKHTVDDEKYSTLNTHIANEHVEDKFKERYLSNFSLENMKKLIIEGKQILSMRYRMVHDDGTYQWRETCADIYQSRENGHFMAFAYVRAVDNQIKWQDYVSGPVGRDPLLHIYDKDYFVKLVDAILLKETCPHAFLLLLDMDRFGMIKESFGQKYSDEVIRNIITIIKATVSPDMLIGKYYNDRFMIFIKEPEDMKNIFLLSNTLQKRIQNAFKVGDKDYILSVSLGVAETGEVSEHNFAALYDLAEKCLLRMKDNY